MASSHPVPSGPSIIPPEMCGRRVRPVCPDGHTCTAWWPHRLPGTMRPGPKARSWPLRGKQWPETDIFPPDSGDLLCPAHQGHGNGCRRPQEEGQGSGSLWVLESQPLPTLRPSHTSPSTHFYVLCFIFQFQNFYLFSEFPFLS